MDNTALLVTVFCLLVWLQPATQQVLQPGANCDGERRNLCGSNTVCTENSVEHLCYNKIGQNCTIYGQGYALCERDSYCEVKKSKLCAIPLNRDCSKHRDLCFTGLSCDAINVCRTRVNGRCNSPVHHTCGAGAICVNRQCTCMEGLFQRKGTTCVPVVGKTGGECSTEGKKCTDPHGTCNKKTGLCECKRGYVPSTRDFTCKVDFGRKCDKNLTQPCRLDAVCDVDGKCRFIAGQSCAGDRAEWCQLDDVCKEGLCRNRIGDSCKLIYQSRDCEPPTSCWNSKICNLRLNQSCAAYRNSCDPHCLCDAKTLICKKKIDEVCLYDGYCISGAVCVDFRCKCQPEGKGVWNTTIQACELPAGKAGGPCHTATGEKPCEDPYAKCNSAGVCECKRGYESHPNQLHCVMRGNKCSVRGNGKINTYFNKKIDVRLPCTFRLASIKCGRAKVKVHAHNSYEPKIHNTLITAVNITIIDEIDGGDTRTSVTYDITLAKITEYQNKTGANGSAWETVSKDAESPDSDVILSTNVSSGVSMLQRKLLKITYTPPVISRLGIGQYSVHKWGQVLVECGHSSFESLQRYPYSLCGQPEDTEGQDLSTYQRRVEKELKNDLPNTFGYVSRDAFTSARLTDRAILIEQSKVIQSNLLCTDASDIVADKECPALQEKLYNCSNMYDANNPIYASYPDCVDAVIKDPMKLFVSCLRAQCSDLGGDGKNDVCQTLQIASDQCDAIKGVDSPYFPRYGIFPKVMEITDLLTLANCSHSQK